MYLSNHAVSATGDPRPRNAWPNRIHSTGSGKITPTDYHSATYLSGSDTVERACPGRPGANCPITGDKTPPKLKSEPCWTNSRKDRNELGTFIQLFIYNKKTQGRLNADMQVIFTMIKNKH